MDMSGATDASLDLDTTGSRVASGYIFNPSSGRTIKIGGDTYIRLLDAGWRPDLVNGTMRAPPPPESTVAGGASSRSGAGVRGTVGMKK